MPPQVVLVGASPPHVGLICALPQEHAHLLGAMSVTATHRIAGVEFTAGELDGHAAVLAAAGMGKVNVAVVATLLAERFGCAVIVFSGVGGGLDPDLDIGDVVIADRTIQHDAGVIEDSGLRTYQAGHVPFLNPTDRFGYPADPALLGRVRTQLDGFELPPLSRDAGGGDRPPRITYGTVLTGDQYLACETTRERLHADLGGRAVEMEGGALSQVCESFGIPWLVIRALSDLAGREAHFDFAAFVDEVAAGSATILRKLLPVLSTQP
jgi:adenosylhomocysteine nucleosidase